MTANRPIGDNVLGMVLALVRLPITLPPQELPMAYGSNPNFPLSLRMHLSELGVIAEFRVPTQEVYMTLPVSWDRAVVYGEMVKSVVAHTGIDRGRR